MEGKWCGDIHKNNHDDDDDDDPHSVGNVGVVGVLICMLYATVMWLDERLRDMMIERLQNSRTVFQFSRTS